ncbi:ral GTPase-activating protein subunit beta-like isoform X1 [Xiphophorus maculatus]|uniref:ral GTPase-activating protein subunit beta-like isoform X1 n=1 Tax=Xiphophorus maculatus TaxID=8083 RepID=UPI000C6DDAB8|nr:ral GTPase-activating protein subunit beta-like isoform X1 [Xiphophorus maculatus]
MDQFLKGQVSVLSSFPPSVGRDVAVAVVKPLAAGLGNPGTRSLLRTDWQVKWTMEVLCYGLTLPSNRDTVKLCVDVYTDWMMALVSQKSSTPPPISRDPNLYVQRILRHLYILFLPRSGQVSPVYLSLCQQVLSSVQSLARESSVISSETWQALLHFLLRVNHTLLAPPTPAGGLSDLSVAVLLEVWLLACSRCFPCRSLWQTFRQMFSSWRHQPAVVEQWSRVAAGLTSRLLPQMFGPSFPPFKVPDEDASLVPPDMEGERISHTWFKFLHLFSNPVDLIGPAAGSSLDEDVQLPGIFFRAMRSVSELVDAFLGVTERTSEQTEHLLPNTELGARSQSGDRLPSQGKQPQSTDPVHQNSSVVPVHLPVIFPPGFSVSRSPFRDRLPSYGFSRPRSGSAPPSPVNFPTTPEAPPIKSFSSSCKQQTPSSPNHWKSSSRLPSSCPPLSSAPQCPAHPLRCNMDSLLHLFGSWLFEAALITSGKRADVTVMSDRWAAGRAEACGTLCRIFTCKKTAENIQSVYLSRFYLVLLRSLQDACPPVLVSVLLNSTRLFCCDLRGVNLLLPSFVSVLETVLLDRDLIRFKGLVSPVDLRRSSIFILLSLMPLPVQLGPAQIQNSVDLMMGCEDATAGDFLSFKPRLCSLLIGALQIETDTCNIQLLLAAMLNVVHDSAAAEAPPPSPDPGQSRRSDYRNQEVQFRATSGTSRTSTPTTQSEAAVLWVHVVRLLTQRLTSQWRNDPAVCLSALEVLGGLAKVEVQVEASERRRAVGSVCTYIVFQCGRPPPLHSRDLHSIIVAAFCCLNTWLTQNPVLLHQQECLLEVLEIVELGISGSRSRQDQNVVWKDDKDLNPASLRVKEAAEATLSCIMQVSGVGPDPSLRDNALMLDDSSLKRSRYFVLEGSVILATLEPTPDQPDQEPSPSLLVILRGPSGHHSWTLQLHLLPKDGRDIQTQAALVPRQPRISAEDAGRRRSINHQLVPESMERVPSVGADQSIPPLIRTGPAEDQQQLDHLRVTLKTQQEIEAQPRLSGHLVAMATCRPPTPVSCFQVTRLFLSHLGLLTPESVKDPGVNSMQPSLLSLDPSLPGFSDSLRRLDQLPSRNSDCAFVFYMRAGQKTPREILGNVDKKTSISGPFLDFLSSLGCPEEVGGASGSELGDVLGDSGGGVFDGRRFVLKFADALTEITFIVPSSHTYTDWLKSYEEAEHATASSSNQKRAETRPSEDIRSCQSVSSFFRSDSKLLIVWVELFEDIEKFPLTDLLLETRAQIETGSSNIQLIFIHPLKTGLFRICFHGNASTKLGLVVPLVNGMVTSRRSLGFLLTEMASNCSRRCRLDSDSAPPPQVRRKHLINDIILYYKSRCSEPAFYTALFQL